MKTKVYHRTLDPVYEEDFTFYGVHFNRLQVHQSQGLLIQNIMFQILSLHFLVLSFDHYSRDDVIGEVNVPIEELGIEESSVTPLLLMKEITPRCSKGINLFINFNLFINLFSCSWLSKDLESFLSLSVTNQDQEESLWWF